MEINRLFEHIWRYDSIHCFHQLFEFNRNPLDLRYNLQQEKTKCVILPTWLTIYVMSFRMVEIFILMQDR